MSRYMMLFVCLCTLTAIVYSLPAAAVQSSSGSYNSAFIARYIPAEELRHILHDEFIVVTTVNAMPQSVQQQLEAKSAIPKMLDAGQPFLILATDKSYAILQRRLVFAAANAHYCFVSFEYQGDGGGNGTEWVLFKTIRNTFTVVWGREPYPRLENIRTFSQVKQAIARGYYLPASEVIIPDPDMEFRLGLLAAESGPSETDKQHLQHDQFTAINTVEALPASLKANLLGKTSANGMADPGQPFQSSHIVTGELPWRRLIFAEANLSFCLVFYEHGGMQSFTQAAFYSLSPTGTATLLWRVDLADDPAITFDQLKQKIISNDTLAATNYLDQ